MKMLIEIYRHRELLSELVKRDIKIKYRRSVLGFFWSVLNPLLFMLVMTMIFSQIFQNTIKHFPIYFLAGQLIFAFFSEATGAAQSAIYGNGSLIKKIYIPKYIFPLAKICSSGINMLFSGVAIIIMLFILGYLPPITALLWFIPIIYVFIFSVGIGLVLASYTVFFRDLVYLYGLFITILSYFSALFYPITIIPEAYRGLIEWNPIYIYIDYFRELLLYGRIPGLYDNLICIGMAMLSVIIGMLVFNRNENKFILYV